jgi:hypothetical protein
MPMKKLAVLLFLILVGAISMPGQRRPMQGPPVPTFFAPDPDATDEFTFVRTIYSSPFRGRFGRGGRGGGYGSWATDFPEADYHFIAGARRWSGTNLQIATEPRQLRIPDPNLFRYPLIYIVEPGFLWLSTEEAQRLREYLLRGGLLFLDDFWGEYEWINVQEQMQLIFPEYTIVDLPLDHPVFHSYFDIKEIIQIPGIGSWLGRGETHEKGGITPHYMGILDDQNRLLVFISRNSDLGDAWEWINDERYPKEYGLEAYRLAINVIIYAMSH